MIAMLVHVLPVMMIMSSTTTLRKHYCSVSGMSTLALDLLMGKPHSMLIVYYVHVYIIVYTDSMDSSTRVGTESTDTTCGNSDELAETNQLNLEEAVRYMFIVYKNN